MLNKYITYLSESLFRLVASFHMRDTCESLPPSETLTLKGKYMYLPFILLLGELFCRIVWRNVIRKDCVQSPCCVVNPGNSTWMEVYDTSNTSLIRDTN